MKALDQLGLAYLSLDKPQAAEKVFRRAFALAPENPEVLMHLGRALIASDRADEAQHIWKSFANCVLKRLAIL